MQRCPRLALLPCVPLGRDPMLPPLVPERLLLRRAPADLGHDRHELRRILSLSPFRLFPLVLPL